MISTIIISLITVIVVFILSVLIGRYIQNRFHLLISNTHISYAIGFSVYIAMITLLFMPIVFFAWPTFMLLSVFSIFNILLVVFLALNWKILNLKNISIYQLILFLILAIILLVTTRFLTTIPNSGRDYFFSQWVKSNLDVEHLNDKIAISKYHFGEGWYYFQTILLKILNIDQNFMNFWVLGGIVNIFIASVVTGFVFSIIKKNNIWIYASSIGVVIFINWATGNGEAENIGSIPMMWNFILLLTIFISYISAPKIQYMYLLAVVNYAGWSFNSVQLFLSISFMFSAVLLMLFKKSHLIVEFIIIFSYSIFVMLLIFLFNISYIAFSLLFIVFIVWLFVATYIVNNNIRDCHEYSLILIQKKWIILASSFVIILILSMIFWLTKGRDPWLSFKYDSNSLISSLSKNILISGLSIYVVYWISFIIFAFIIYNGLKNGVGNNKIMLLLTLSGFTVMFFFNPLVAPLWVKNTLEVSEYFEMKILTLLPLIMVLPLLLYQIKWTYILQPMLALGSLSLVFSLFATNQFKIHNLSLYNGVNKDVATLGKYINRKLSNKKIAGYLDGLESYISNPLSFEVFSPSFNVLRNNILTDAIYSQVDNTQVDLLIQLKDHIGNFKNKNIYKSKYQFNNFLFIGKYEIFYK